MFKLKIISASTRPVRKGPVIAKWISDITNQYPDFITEVIDLADVNLPMFDEPNHPMLQKYVNQHTKEWSKIIDDADAFIFVMPEYNHSFLASIKNAIDYLHKEWQYKPLAFVSYGGLSGGIRAVAGLKPVVSALKMVPITESVSLTFYSKYIKDDVFAAEESHIKSAHGMLKELLKWTPMLKEMREEKFSLAEKA